MAYDVLQYETRGDVALITLNRPDKLNAWTPQMSLEQVDAIERANADRSIGAVVMTGAGRGFCAGADMERTFKERIEGRDPGGDTAHGEGGMPAGIDWVALCRRSKPLVAAVNGAAVGIGMTMILPFDVIIASEKARFGMLFIKVGLVPELASTHLLTARIGLGKASEMCLTGRVYSAVGGGVVGPRGSSGRAGSAARHGRRPRSRDRREPGPAAAHDQGALGTQRLRDRSRRRAAARERDAARVLEEHGTQGSRAGLPRKAAAEVPLSGRGGTRPGRWRSSRLTG